ncbi:MAG: hypothetical protein DME26_15440 [Verrucomicrobia bacterium]|nr:MAG: hypothetical protein DME26_15440 [Verrucomicrobiota bacterium]
MKPLVFLAQLETVFAEKPSKSYSYGVREILIVIGIALALSAGLFIWAAFWRKRKRAHSSSQHRQQDLPPGGEPSESSHKRHKRRHRKASHPDKRPRNPTLAETGGLPPARPEGQVPNFNPTDAGQPSHNPQERL